MKRGPDTIRSGFTLIELVLVVALVAILASIAVSRSGWETMDKIQVQSNGRQFSNYLKLARSLAITHASSNGVGYEVVLSPSQPYTYSLINSDTSQVIKGPIALPEGVSRSGDMTYEFTPLGNLSGSQELSVQFSKSDNTSVVTVTPIGRIKIE